MGSQDNDGHSLFWHAAETWNMSTIRLLLRTGKVSADMKDFDRQTSVSEVTRTGHDDMVRLLLNSGRVT